MEEYIKVLTEQIRCKQAKTAVAQEVQAHMEDMLADLKQQGMETEQAIDQVLRDMGDPVEAGVALDRVHRPKIAWHMIAVVVILSVLGLCVQYMISEQCSNCTFFSLSKQLTFFVVGFILMLGMYYLDYSFFGAYGKILAVEFLAFMTVEVFFMARVVNGAVRFSVGTISVSMPLLMLLYVPVYAGVLYAYRGEKVKGIVISAIFLLYSVWLTLCMPCLSMAIILFFTLTVMLSMALKAGWFGKKYDKMFYGVWAAVILVPPIALAAAIKLRILADYQIARIETFVNRNDIHGAGYQINNIRNLLEQSKFWGGNQEMDISTILPNVGEDFVLTHLISYYGILSGILVFSLLLLLVGQIFRITIKQKNQLGKMIGIGCGSMLGTIVLVYFLENVGALPYSYTYLPFFTAGGSGTIITFLLLGIVLSVYKYQNIPLTVKRKKIQIKIKVE